MGILFFQPVTIKSSVVELAAGLFAFADFAFNLDIILCMSADVTFFFDIFVSDKQKHL